MSRLILVAAAMAVSFPQEATCQSRRATMPQRRDSAHSARIDSTVRAVLASRNIPGATVSVLFRDTVLHTGAYGVADLSRNTPTSASTVFQIASLTKPMTAMAVMLLVDEGKLGLDDAASRYVPQLPAVYSRITIRQLLTHTSGVSPDMRRANVDEMELAEFWRRFSERPIAFAPGANIQYANAGYTILSVVVERVSGFDFGTFLHRRVFEPLGMGSSGYRVAKTDDGRHATGYDLVDGRNVEQPHVFSGWGNSGVETTIDDLARFAGAIDRRELLTGHSWDLMFSPGLLASMRPASFAFGDARAHYGLGWFLTTSGGRTLHTHGGAIAGFSSILNRFPDERYTVIVLSNGKQGTDRLGQADAIARAIDQVRESNLRREIDSLNRAMERAFEKGDMKAVSAFYADDARLMGPRNSDVAGRAAIDQYWMDITGARSWKLDVLDVGGDRHTAYQVGRSTLVVTGPNGDRRTVSRFVVVWKRQPNGQLRIALDFYHF